MIFSRAGTSEKGTERGGETDQRGRRDLEDQEAEQECRCRPRRDGGGEAADLDTRPRSSAVTEGASGTGTRGATGQETGHCQVNERNRRTLLYKF